MTTTHSAADASRYIALVSDYNGQAYNSFHFRNRGTANSQLHYFSQWYTYDGGTASSTGSGSIVKKLLGKQRSRKHTGIFRRKRFYQIRCGLDARQQRGHAREHPRISRHRQMDACFQGSAKATEYLKPKASAIVLKTGGKQCGYVDNIIIWEGTGDEPTDKELSPAHLNDQGLLRAPLRRRRKLSESFQVHRSRCCGFKHKTAQLCERSRHERHPLQRVPCLRQQCFVIVAAHMSPHIRAANTAALSHRLGQGIDDPLLLKENESLMAIISKTNASGFDDYCKKLKVTATRRHTPDARRQPRTRSTRRTVR